MWTAILIPFSIAVICFSYVGYVLFKQRRETRQLEINTIKSEKAEFNAKKMEASKLLGDLKELSNNLIVQLESPITGTPNCKVEFPDYFDQKSETIEKNFTDEEIIQLIRLKSYINEIVNEHKRVYEFGKTWERNIIEGVERGKYSKIVSDLSEKEFMAPVNYDSAYEIRDNLIEPIKQTIRSINDKKDQHSDFFKSISNLETLCSTLDDLALSMVMMRLAKNKIGYLTIYNVFDRLGVFYDGYQLNTLKSLEDISHGLIELRGSLDKIHLAIDQISGELASVGNTLYNIEREITFVAETGDEINSAVRAGNLLNTINLIQNRKLLKELKPQ
jgi:hypothetical protein